MKFFIFMVLGCAQMASADVSLSVGDSVRVSGQVVTCGVGAPAQQVLYKCKVRVCRYNRINNSCFFCSSESDWHWLSYNGLSSDKAEQYEAFKKDRGIGCWREDTFTCDEK